VHAQAQGLNKHPRNRLMRPFELTFQQGELILDLREIQIVD
jgi:hypothetical protein